MAEVEMHSDGQHLASSPCRKAYDRRTYYYI